MSIMMSITLSPNWNMVVPLFSKESDLHYKHNGKELKQA